MSSEAPAQLSFGESDDAQILAKGVHAILANKGGAAAQRRTFDLFSLSGKVVLITGALGGLGLEMTFALAEVGATVYCVDTADASSDVWNEMQAYLNELPELPGGGKGKLVYVKGDVREHALMDKIVKDLVAAEGRIDVCFAHAGIGGVTAALDIPEELLENVLSINTKGCLYTAQAAGREMKRLGIQGSIVFTSSVLGHVSCRDPPNLTYAITKAALHQMSRSLACELGPVGIRCNTMSPGYIMTQAALQVHVAFPQVPKVWAGANPMGRLGRPDEIRGLTVFLASDASSYITGTDIIMDGGHRAW